MKNYITVVAHGARCGVIYLVTCTDYEGDSCRAAALNCHKYRVENRGAYSDEDYWYAFQKKDCDKTIDAFHGDYGWVKIPANTI